MGDKFCFSSTEILVGVFGLSVLLLILASFMLSNWLTIEKDVKKCKPDNEEIKTKTMTILIWTFLGVLILAILIECLVGWYLMKGSKPTQQTAT